jgi:ABC-type xylose transport system permease subunit
MATTALGGAMAFLERLGVFETVLPFLLVFTLVFAFLEKTKIFGTEKWKSQSGTVYDVTRKNMNSMAAFCIAFFVIASAQLVKLISEVTSKIVLLIVLIFCFMLTVGAMRKEDKEGFELSKTWIVVFEIIVFIAIALIFLDALGWLDDIFDFLGGIWGSEATASLVLVIIMIGFMAFITWDKKPGEKKEEKK